ncbi:GGDEF domain-containing protein, partial [Rhizobiaceae sp. 2RAB30]
MDLDHFKAINDSHGHAAGDIVLAKTVGACVDRLRETDISGRLGGEEFAFVLPHTERAKALNVAEQLQRTVARLPIPAGGRTLNVTASFGVAAVDAGTRDVDHLLRKADEALYRAKSAGRNQCKAAPVSETKSRDMHRVFKGGQIILTDGSGPAVDCTVRALSDLGAGIDISSDSGLPETFVLSIRSEG